MASAIGIRVYKIVVRERGRIKLLSTEDSGLAKPVFDFVSEFIARHSQQIQNEQLERSWFFESKAQKPRNNQGYIHYGTFGFESNFIDNKTKKRNYRRQISDIEEIPLYYDFWFPKGQEYGLVAFQSFQGRSCITLTLNRLQEWFEGKSPGHMLRFHKLSPADARGKIFSTAPVKNLRLTRRNAPSDIADQYFSAKAPREIDVQLVISARRKSVLGRLRDVINPAKKQADSILSYEGIEFSEAVADIQFGGQTRRVNVWGAGGDAGVVDITNQIVRGSDGHPTFESLQKETGRLLRDFSKVLASRRNEN